METLSLAFCLNQIENVNFLYTSWIIHSNHTHNKAAMSIRFYAFDFIYLYPTLPLNGDPKQFRTFSPSVNQFIVTVSNQHKFPPSIGS